MMLAHLAAVNSFMILQMVPLWEARASSSLAVSFVNFTLWAYSVNSPNCNGIMEYMH